MPNYIEYRTDEDSTVLVEIEEPGGLVRASNKPSEPVPSQIKFKQAFASVRSSIKDVLDEFENLQVQEGEIKFGIKCVGEAGLFAVGKLGGEVNYEITLKWKKPDDKKAEPQK
jgi:hypothetical protein